ncbi:MAG TPA: TraB/GumN family protein, partial [Verrucomicrobiae bacterium]
MRINKRWLFLLAAICLTVPLRAQPQAASRHTLWKMQGPQNSVYLLGSAHVLQASDYPLAAPIETAFSNAAIVAFETDIAALDDPAIAMKLLSKSRLPEGETLNKQVSPEVYKMWVKQVTEAGLPPEMFERFTPGMAAITISMLELQKLGLDPKHGVDKHFFALARQSGKEIVPLEPVEFQINLLTGFSKEEGEGMLKATLKDLANLKTDLAKLLQAWKIGDAA